MRYTTENTFAKDPAVIQFAGKWYLYHSIMTDGVLGIGIAVSDDGEDFTYLGILPRCGECEQNGIGAPGAIVHGGRVHLFYQTYGNEKLDAICHAFSDDGIHFTRDARNPVFAPRAPWADMPDWSCGRAIDADVCIFGDRLYLYFATRDRAFRRQITGVAFAPVTEDLTAPFTLCPEPVLAPELPWEGACIEAPAALVWDKKVYLFYAGAYNCSPQVIGCAVSEDGVRFRRLFVDVPFLANGAPGTWNASESGHPYVYRADDGSLWLYYQGSPDNGKSWYLSRMPIDIADGMPKQL